MKRSVYRAKRTLDVVGSLVGLLLLLPLLPAVALAIRLDSPGPIFFRQQRVGIDRRASSAAGSDRRRRKDLGGALFAMIKFRTMRADAERLSGPSWTADNDPRITRAGAVLRRTKIDELPQLWNVLRGEMSLIGPRPETPHFVEKLAAELPVYRERVAGVKPGISGLAQIHCEDDGSFFGSLREKIYYDLLYGANLLRMRHWHEVVRLDLGIILKTLERLLQFHKTIDADVIRIELPRWFEVLGLKPEAMARNVPYGVRSEVLDSNPDKITVWWYLPRRRDQEQSQRDYLGVDVMRQLTDEMTYTRGKDGMGVNELELVKYLTAEASRHASLHTHLSSMHSGHLADRIKLEVPSKLQYIPKVGEFLAPIWERLRERSGDPHFAFNMSLLVIEGLTNVVKHAHRDCPEKRIPVELVLTADRVRVKMLDYGRGFDLDRVGPAERDGWFASLIEPLCDGAKRQPRKAAS